MHEDNPWWKTITSINEDVKIQEWNSSQIKWKPRIGHTFDFSKGFGINPSKPSYSNAKPKAKTISLSKLLGFGILAVMVITLVYVSTASINMQGKPAVPTSNIIPDSEIVAKYPLLTDLSKALKSGEIHTTDLSKNMQNVVEKYKLYP